MIFAPLSWNRLASGTVDRSADYARGGFYQRGNPEENALSQALDLRWTDRGRIGLATGQAANKFQYNIGGGPVSVTLTQDVVYRSVAEFCAALTAQLVAAGLTNARLYPSTATATRGRIVVEVTSGTIALPIETGSDTASNVLREKLGYRNDDRAAAASHTGDFSVLHDSARLGVTRSDYGAINGLFVVGLDASPGACIQLRTSGAGGDEGTIAPVATYTGPVSKEVLYLANSSPVQSTYAQLVITDPHRADCTRVGCTYVYAGPVFDTDNRTTDHASTDIVLESLSISSSPRSTMRDTLGGEPAIYGRLSGETIALTFSGPAGMAPGGGATLRGLLDELGEQRRVLVCLDDADPARLSRLCLVESRDIRTHGVESPAGRITASLRLRVLETRGRRS